MQPNLTPSQLFMEGLEQHCAEVVAEADDPEFAAMVAEFMREVRDYCLDTGDWTSDSEEHFAVLFGCLAKFVWTSVAHMRTGAFEAPYELSEILAPHRERS
ncbi:hypothetical protein PPSIR1_06011 [Plesiocystis pacifica SIR-1]|uniref:Uncharacterized protein n=1 Tax=Plesiocystis pacifica SIR-1 TaxID=391625 RepID=A6G6S7_9BACT|nr:hypothetical protein [Plesiocystis pacifica]EDM78380.1 hypothetical protein PPSIR1_06011 [Plesiocystis pacifica SIR-1]